MSDPIYARFAATADRLLRAKGQPMTLIKREPGAYDPTTASGTVSEVLHACTGVELDYPAGAIDGTLVIRGDRRVLLSPVGLAASPQTEDSMTIGASHRKIMSARKVAPAGDVVLWELQVRA